MKYKQLAKLYEKMTGNDNIVLAIQCYDKAINALKQSEGDSSRRLCSLFNDIGVLHMQQQNYALALKNLSHALDLCIKGRTDSKEMSSVYLIQVRLNLANCYSLQQDADRAMNAIRHALDMQKELRAMHLSMNRTHVGLPPLLSVFGLANTQKRLAKELVAQKKFKEARAVLQEGLALVKTEHVEAQDLAPKNPTIDLTVYQDGIAGILFALAEVHQADSSKKSEAAIKLYRESLQLRKTTDKLRPSGEKSNSIHCMKCMAGIGSVQLESNKSSDAFKIFSAAIHLARKEALSDSHPVLKMLWDKSHAASRKMLVDSSIETKAEF